MSHLPRTHACPSFHAGAFSRRHALKVGGLGLLGFTLPGLLRAESLQKRKAPVARVKSVIFLFQFGGSTHIDMWDMKPDAPEGIRGPHKPIATKADGIQISEHLPRMAKVMDKVTLIRSMHHRMRNHNSASYYAISGHAPPVDDITLRDSPETMPAYGSVVDKLAPGPRDLPTFVSFPHVIADGVRTPGQAASFLGRLHDPLFIGQDPSKPDFALPELTLPAGLSYERLQHRREIQQRIDAQSRLLDYSATARGMDEHYLRALAMLNSPRLRKAFDLSQEPAAVRDRYGRHTYGQSCLLARRLVEAGVTFVTVSGAWGYFDHHGDEVRWGGIEKGLRPLLPIVDRTLHAIVTDLEDRGLLESTLILMMGEFGRSPVINKNAGRDHWPRVMSMIMAGGGLRHGQVIGSTDRHGHDIASRRVGPSDLAATVFQHLGIDLATQWIDQTGRPRPIVTEDGRPIEELS